jgi:hypothetical protein
MNLCFLVIFLSNPTWPTKKPSAPELGGIEGGRGTFEESRQVFNASWIGEII